MTQQLSTNTFGCAKWVVSADATQGTHTTIAGALTSASSGDTIFIRPGTYTENLTLKAGVNLSAYDCDASSGQVTISGKCTFTAAGQVNISGIRLQTNSDFALAVTGSAASVVILDQCQIVNTNNTAISFTSSSASASINLDYCRTFVPATNSLFASSSAGTINFFWCNSSCSSSAASTNSGGGALQMSHCYWTDPLSISAGAFIIVNSSIRTFGTNTTCVTTSGTSSGTITGSYLESGTASAISVGNTLIVADCTIYTSNTNAITWAGTLSYCGLDFGNTSSNINTTTQTLLASGPSRTIGSSNSGNTNTLTVTNTSNTATSSANIVASVAGSTAADPTHQSVVSGVTTWTWGIDNSVTVPTADTWVLAQGTTLGTNNVMSVATSGEINFPLQSAFLAFNSTTRTNVTGDNTEYTCIFDTEVFDQNADFDATSTFTAPVTGRYYLIGMVYVNGGTVINGSVNKLVTSNRTYRRDGSVLSGGTTSVNPAIEVLADMDAADTATITISTNDTGGKIDDVFGAATPFTWFSGNLEC